jgi:hypothetical protein
MSPVLSPTGGCVWLPAAKIDRWLPVIANRYTQDEQRHKLRLYNLPWTVIPGTRIPVIVIIYPVHSIIEKIVGSNLWRVVDRVARNPNQFRVHRHVDSNTYARQTDADTDINTGFSVDNRD